MPIKNKAAVALGKRGGKARAKKLTPERRREIAQLAIATRWLAERQNGAAKKQKSKKK
jgi:hypothetical protein